MFKIKEIIESVKGKPLCVGPPEASGISTDSRILGKGEFFVAIKGTRYDGHDFVGEVFKKGAVGALISNKYAIRNMQYAKRKSIILVDDTVKALGRIAHSHRMKFKNLKVIAVTGSNGKTTTKELIAAALSSRFSVLKNEASFNNSIGLPMTLLGLKGQHTACVLEMGMSRPGEIKMLSDIAWPGMGVITNVGPSHLEFLKTQKNIFTAKSELLKSLSAGCTAVLNKDDRFLKKVKTPCRKIYFGINSRCGFRATNLIYKNGCWKFRLGKKNIFSLPLIGIHSVYNALAAIAVARALKVDFDCIKSALEGFELKCASRMSGMNLNGLEIIDDTYNSNPLSMRCAIRTLSDYETAGRRILVTGDMLELGSAAKAFHAEMGKRIAKSNIDMLITMGDLSKFAAKNASIQGMPEKRIFQADSHREAASFLKKISGPGDVVLIKGSRSMEMEKIIYQLKTTVSP